MQALKKNNPQTDVPQPFAKLVKKIDAKIAQACSDFNLIAENDRILVCLSGGKDSYTLLDRLEHIQSRLPFEIELIPFHLDQNQPGYPKGVMEDYLKTKSHRYEIADVDTYSAVKELVPDDKTPCSVCSRLRRGIIYTTAEKYDCNKVALGHHRDDSIQTLLLNMFYAGQLQGMPAKYTTDDKRFQVIRPLVYVPESWIIAFAQEMDFPIIPCNLFGSLEGKRKEVERLLVELEEKIPNVKNSIIAAMTNVRVSHLLDQRLASEATGDLSFEI